MKGQSESVMDQHVWVPTAGVASRWVKNLLSGNISCVQMFDTFQQSSFACFSQMFETTWARLVTEGMTLQIEVPGVSKFRVVWHVASTWILLVPLSRGSWLRVLQHVGLLQRDTLVTTMSL